MTEFIFSMPKVIGSNARVLILGSMPGQESLAKQQYYANPRNQFWRIIYALFDQPTDPAYDQKIEFLKKHRIALWDSVHCCTRKGSLDSAIRDERANDIPGLLAAYPSIRAIAFNGSKAFAVFQRYFKSSVPPNVALIKMPSTSPTPSRYPKTQAEKIQEWSQMKRYL
ncbi:DNA-deoxyinosine glycosylase [Sporolactobacillus sp. CPB3-1]|uniref:DNA-deoxyinosine glycosylase n=1 Tax=Sporolactobacillus mangiferae TaxID=2940498 RepID=A0ABT0M980_9BACL|nr:DNA-deoxyinosine glycosylase [Sporolactobacillus mangiferae]MCL1631427.1 DNA-deoxyinosine glycosylase [Sporolactobacillus mangiferae]